MCIFHSVQLVKNRQCGLGYELSGTTGLLFKTPKPLPASGRCSLDVLVGWDSTAATSFALGGGDQFQAVVPRPLSQVT
jgi:hypothetical protein